MAKLPSAPANTSGEKQSLWDKTIVSTPVILTVIATILAGLSNSELNLAQYSRALAAQMQSKASDQWAYFQAKKIRAEQNQSSADLLQSIAQPIPFTAADLEQAAARLLEAMNLSRSPVQAPGLFALRDFAKGAATQPAEADAILAYGRGDIPKVADAPIEDSQITAVIQGVDAHVSDAELQNEAGKIPQANLDKAVAGANAQITAFEDAVAKQTQRRSEIDKLGQQISRELLTAERGAPPPNGATTAGSLDPVARDMARQLNASFAVARFTYKANQYNADARYNQTLGQLYEIQVRMDGYASDRHRARSKEFFYGMLGAQAGVTIATFALAVRRRSVLWSLAASAGFVAISFAAYVYLFV